MDNTEIIIYIIVISIVFISAFAKKRIKAPTKETQQPPQSHQPQPMVSPVIDRIANTTTDSDKFDHYSWDDGYDNNTEVKNETEVVEKPTPLVNNSNISLNSVEELRRAVILSEILERKF